MTQYKEKIEALIEKMTIDEKIGQLTQMGANVIYGDIFEANTDHIRRGEIGSFIVGASPQQLNELQRIAVEESRLGIPLLFAKDVIHGYRTIFPIPVAESCSWDINMAKESARIAAKEASAAGLHWTFSPMVDIARDSRWGRIAEGAGEDTYLQCKIAEAKVKGYQGDDISEKDRLISCAKHFVAYGAAIGGRDYNSVDMSLETLFEVYLPPFQAAVDAGVESVMTAFHDFNGVPCTGNEYLLKDVLRDTMGFKGVVVSDSCSVREILVHKMARDEAEAAKYSITAGTDIEMHTTTYRENIKKLLESGELDIAVVDDAVRRVLSLKFRKGLFDNPYVDEEREAKELFTRENLDTALKVAQSSIVLLKNENKTLPLKGSARKILVVGELAFSKADMLGCWAACGKADECVSIYDGIKERFKECEIYTADNINDAVRKSLECDTVIAVVGETKDMSGEAKSRASQRLSENHRELIHTLSETGKDIVMVVVGGRPLVLTEEEKKCSALLMTWHLGTQAGNAVATVLAGDINPSGKLTATFPSADGQTHMYYNHNNTGKPARDDFFATSKYIDAPIKPLYPFGYGLSYTSFKYDNLKLDKKEFKIGEKLCGSIEITNAGELDGEEVVQLYISQPYSRKVRPVRELKWFDKVFIKKGETQKVRFSVETDSFGYYNAATEYINDGGEFNIIVSASSEGGLEEKINLIK